MRIASEAVTANGKWAVVTGASSGIGRATALALAHDKWNVAVHYRQSEAAALAVADDIRRLGTAAFIQQADFGEATQCAKTAESIWKKTGGVDAWIHLAGADTLTGANAKLSFEEKLDMLTRIDLVGTMRTCRSVGELMVQQGRGAIVTVGWDQAATGMAGDSGQLFAAIKGGVMAFSRSLAKSLAPKVRVNCVAPGWIKTAWGEGASTEWQKRAVEEAPLARWGTPADVAAAIVYLVSDRASFVTGQTINVNGGVVTT